MLQVVDLLKHYPTAQGPLQVLDGVSLQLAQGESLALMGESGSGKSTLLHLIAGLDRADGGHIEVDGQRLGGLSESGLANWRRTGIGLVFQQFNLIGSLKVADNLAFQARLAGRYDPAWQAHLVERLGLGDLLARYPEQLSGGQQQRVAIGRALASRPALLLADEPTGNLDEATSDEVLKLLLALLADSPTSLLMVTHSPRMAAHLMHRVVLHKGGWPAPTLPEMAVLYWTLRALLSHWRRHPVQLFSVLTGLWLATGLLTGVQALNSQARDSYQRASQLLGGEPQSWLSTSSATPFAQQVFVDLRRAGWPVSPQVQGRVTLNGERVQLIGIEPLTLPRDLALAGQGQGVVQLLDFLRVPGVTWIARDTLHALGLEEGQQPQTDNGQALPPLRSLADMAPGVLLTDIGQAQQVLAMPGQISRLLVARDFAAANPVLPATVAGLLVLQHGDSNDDLARLTDSFHLNLDALGVLAFVVGLFIVHAAIGLALEQRRGLLRNLRASGVSARLLIAALSLELIGMALLAAVAGVISGYLLASWLLPDLAASLRGLYGAAVAGQLDLSVSWWLSSLGVALLGALLAGASSLLRAARLPLLALARVQAWRQAYERWLRRQAQISALALATALLALAGNSLLSGFILVSALLLSAALGLPMLLDKMLGAALRRSRSVLSQWFLADCRQQLPALSLALIALLLALAASIGAGSMTSGFRQTFGDWLDQRLSAELYVTAISPEQARDLHLWLTQQPTVSAVLPDWQVSLRLHGWPAELHGAVANPHYRDHWPLLAASDGDAWQRLADQDSVMISEQLARRLGVGLNDALDIPVPQSRWTPRIVGLYADYGNARGHLLVDSRHLLQHWPDLSPIRFNLRIAPADMPALTADLQATFMLDDSHIIDQQQLKAWSSRVFERTFAATTALNSLTLGVAGIALFISLLTQSQNRLGQLAPLWALGVTRRQLMLLNLGQTWLLASLTLLAALPLGLLLAWCLNAVIQVQAFGWRLPSHLYPGQWLSLMVLALLATLLASAWPLWRLYRSQPSDLLRSFDREN